MIIAKFFTGQKARPRQRRASLECSNRFMN
jgi:hypothetical protein